ncbi:4'-phosphopantetheinyl transferase family protein [Arenimonas composti]|uniref:4'-phosphopantetheinyl transferase domain-containing protein n=1 Tax=Arenimonas composti TR7-09 = DSM 18010 TaxID=1121013 RepID=A0A091BPS5_9GAMM|nr:4'-phosphopantetheinyl transferase superfamily protein [Arenimonas composti]KFN46320.1 hypothetical protein P873_02090 [Arenimonas composti TR7-09 = DSM 18010]
MAEQPVRLAIATLAPLAEAAAGRGEGWLVDSERARVAAMTLPLRRAQYLAGHWFARELAAEVLREAPERLAFTIDAAGRPRIAIDGQLLGYLSLSHSGECLACAYAADPIGIDLEFPKSRRDLDGVARFTFSPPEREWLSGLAGDEREAAFYRLWTLKEARGKRSGEGLLPGRARRWTALATAAEAAEAATWTVGEGVLAVATDGVSALAPEGRGLVAARPQFWSFRDGD